MFKNLFTTAIVSLLLFTFPSKSQAAQGQLMAGTAKINITPENKLPLHDSVFARVVVLEVGEVRMAQVSLDLVQFNSPRIEQVCRDKYGISTVLLSSSHSHECPVALAMFDRETKYPNYQTFFEDRILKAIDQAVNNMFPARIAAGHRAFPQLGFNRLIVRADGHARESWVGDEQYKVENPDRIPFGPVDNEVGVIKIEDMQGNPKAIIMNYAMHADIACFSYEISADYPGVACRKVEEAFGGKVNCLFVQGAGGNIEALQISRRRQGPKDPIKTDYAPVERTGELLAFETIRLAKQIKATENVTSMNLMTDSLKFTGRFNKDRKFNVHLATILINNNIAIAACPGEMFIQLQLAWKERIRLADTTPFVFGYTWTGGRSPGYVPDVRSAALGGYGAEGGNSIEVGAGETIMNKQLENFYRLNGLMRDKPAE